MQRTLALTLERAAGADAGPTPAPPPARARLWYVNPLAWVALASISLYRTCVPARHKPACRFTPSCSSYMSLAIRRYGLLRGGRRGLQRIRRCVGFVPAGVDWP